MLDNTRKGFAEEMLIISLVTVVLVGLFIYYDDIAHHYPGHSVVQDAIIGSILVFFLTFLFVRMARMAIVYRNRKVIYAIGAFLTMISFGGIGALYMTPDLDTTIFVSGLWALTIITFVIGKMAKRFKRFQTDIPPERYAILRAVMTKKQRFTLIFPDEYIKYLETGDKRFLRDGGNGERKE